MIDVSVCTRSISSQVPQPTSPIQISEVPGRNVNRNGLRNPYETTRRAFASGLEKSGFPGSPAPVSGSIRMRVPESPTGSVPVVVRRS